MGTAAAVSDGTIEVATSAGTYTLFAGPESKIWRGGWQPFSTVQRGDDIWVKYNKGADGRFIITELYANIDHISGRITRVQPGEFEVDQNYDADPHSGYTRRFRQIVYRPGTEFELSAPEDLREGRDVDVIGLKTDISFQVQATRITIYEGKRPVRMPPDARVIPPSGPIPRR